MFGRALVLAAVFAGATAAAAAEAPQTLSFAQAVSLAAQQNAGVTLAQIRVREADAKVAQNRSAFLPSVTAQAVATDRTFNVLALGFTALLPPGAALGDPVVGPVYEAESRLKVSQPLLDIAGWQKWRASKYGVLGARSEQLGAAENAAYNAALAYLRAARAEAVVHAREQDVAIAEDLAGLAGAQLSAGTSPTIDVTRARTQVAAAKGALLVARNQLDRARIDLARAINVDPSTPIALADTLGSGLAASDAPGAADAAVTFALDHRPDLRVEDARLAKARADRTAISTERLPRIDVSGDWGGSGEHYGDSRRTYTYALAVSMPLIDGLKREGRLKEQGDVVRESEVRGKDLRSQVAADVQGALLDLASGLEQLNVAAERLRLADDELVQARDRFTSGVAGNIEVINAQSSRVKAHDADIDARFAVASARAALARAVGAAVTLH